MKNLEDKIEQYILGELEGAERLAFENSLKSDPGLATAVDRQRELMQRLDALRLRGKVKDALAESRGGFDRATLIRQVIFAVGLLTLLWGLIWLINRYSTPAGTNPPAGPQQEQQVLPGGAG